MTEEILTKVRCKDCGILLNEDSNLKLEGREPCPQCGSLVRAITQNIEDKITVSDSFTAKAKSLGIKRPTIEISGGSDLYKSENKLVHKERVIDRKHNSYHEKVVDPKTGEIIHEVEEPLSKHTGHGSAKSKQ